jgi:hypothetical protein
MVTNPYHVSVVRGKLTRAIPELVPNLHDEMLEAFGQNIPPTDGAALIILAWPRTDKIKIRLVKSKVV